MKILIRPARDSDIDTLADYNCRLAYETEQKTLDATVVFSGVRRGLLTRHEVQYFVAEIDGRVVGQLMLTREWSDWRDGWIYWLQSVYVHADHRGTGIFRRMLKHVTDQLGQQNDVACLRLYVEEANRAAIETYHRLGFEDPRYRVLEMPLK